MVRRFPWFCLGGVVVFVCGLFIDSYVTMTGLMAVMLGACIGGVGRGLSVQGMWFLAALLWIPTLFIYGVLTYLHIGHLSQHPADVGRFVSLVTATWLLGIQSRLLLTVTRSSWMVSRR